MNGCGSKSKATSGVDRLTGSWAGVNKALFKVVLVLRPFFGWTVKR